MSIIDAAAVVIDEHLVREMDVAGWWCSCGDAMRRDDPSRHVAEALRSAGVLRADRDVCPDCMAEPAVPCPAHRP